jgi:IstB-like ATP binding protein
MCTTTYFAALRALSSLQEEAVGDDAADERRRRAAVRRLRRRRRPRWSSTGSPAISAWRRSRRRAAGSFTFAKATWTQALAAWHDVIGDPTYADAILDRLVHNAHRIELTGESLRRACGKPSKTGTENHVRGRNSLGQQARCPGRDHLVTGGRIIQEYLGAIIPFQMALHRNRHRAMNSPRLLPFRGSWQSLIVAFVAKGLVDRPALRPRRT